MNKIITKLIVAINNNPIVNLILTIIFLLVVIVGSYKLDSILRHWLG